MLIVAACAVVADPAGEHVLCQAGRSDPMPVAECESRRRGLLEALPPESLISVQARCVAPGDPA